MLPSLTQSAALLGVELTAEAQARFDRYAQELIDWNRHTNLTAITAPHEIEVRHFLDSLTIARAADLRDGARVVDVGSGAGFPGLPLAIVYPRIHVTLLESTGKKTAFLDHVITTLGLTHAVTANLRAEDAGQLPAHRAAYDLVLARAVARLPGLLEYLLPLAKVGGRCIAMKGVTAHAEANDAAHALDLLGGRLTGIETVQLPGLDEPHYLVVVDKIAATPAAYPRKPGIPTRKPLL